MADFSIASFSSFVGLLLLARRLAADPGLPSRAEALAALAGDPRALTAALRDGGLTALAQVMTRQAEETALHFTHPGRARDDAIAVFWQVAPAALADAAALAGDDLDPDRATDRMVAAIKASPHARDFTETVLAEPFFRAIARQALAAMLETPGRGANSG